MEGNKVAVGSTNPVKVQAVEKAFLKVWPQSKVIGADVPSMVSVMPMDDNECIEGAKNRAVAAREWLDADYGVGLEGGVNPEPTGLMLLGWVWISHRNGQTGVACTTKIPLPESLAKRILGGEELGPVMDDVLNEANVAKKGGASGALTAGLVMREDKFEMAVCYALSRFVAPHFYN